ncbi:carboxymuconolactone decarboxylase family protein [Acuticoccus kandeliae]|uniref:carboxymuconolactone decarboxylase family protein n=1 Tax=Acuticoccus kandeliae TaxID=2073160 RepID=UPI000D3E74E7|nr:carboxymuconolactone decarboxylase family protein [Acuticoccus kandeliae]
MTKTMMKTFTGTLLASGLAAGAAAQETARSVAPEAMQRVAPALAQYTDEVLFGEVWPGEGLAPRDRSLIVISALVASGKAPQVRGHARRGLANGLTPVEIGEILTHLAFYSGWPNAVLAAQVVDEVFAAEGIAPLTPEEANAGEPIALEPAAEAARAASVDTSVGPHAPGLAEHTNRVLFGDLWRRPQLSPRDRSFVTVAALIAMGQADQLPYHLGRALDAGLTPEEAGAALNHLAYYVGWPKAFSAVPVLREIVDNRT